MFVLKFTLKGRGNASGGRNDIAGRLNPMRSSLNAVGLTVEFSPMENSPPLEISVSVELHTKPKQLGEMPLGNGGSVPGVVGDRSQCHSASNQCVPQRLLSAILWSIRISYWLSGSAPATPNRPPNLFSPSPALGSTV